MNSLNQIPLIKAESDEALLLPPAELRRRYPAKAVEKIEHRRDPILAMLASGVFTLERIAEACHVNVRTVKQLAELHSAAIAKDMNALGEKFLAEAAMTMTVAKDKRDKASYRDQMVGAGILATNGLALKQAASGAASEAPLVEVNAISEKAERLRKLLAEPKQETSNDE